MTALTATVPDAASPFATFVGSIGALTPIGHSLVRVTCRGDAFRWFGDNGYDQRIKLIVPLAASGFDHFPTTGDWYGQWCALDPADQNPLRTYTVRAVRAEVGEVDVDMVLHGDGGPASAWVAAARVGDPVALLGPNARYDGTGGGVEFVLPPLGVPILLVGDETAQPAIATICEQLPADRTGLVILEMPHPDDRVELARPSGVRVEWLIRDRRPVGELTLNCLREHAAELFRLGTPTEPTTDSADDDEEPWDVPAVPSAGQYAWIAGEAAVVRAVRRLLVNDLGVDKRSIAFMGYWRR